MSHLQNFRNALAGKDFLVLDTETTGLYEGEIVQIAIINSAGETLLNTLVKPVYSIPAEATDIHKITDDMCDNSPTWIDLAPKIKQLLEGKLLVVYNAVYDRKMMHQTAERHGLPKVEWKEICEWHCAMEAFAEFYGDYNRYRGSYRWQKLVIAARHCGVAYEDAHNALVDCQMALGVTKHMLKAESEAKNG
jgi:DNA polymerase-3 subunit epsilon